MKPRASLPHVADEPRRAWSSGWWAGIAVGFINGMAAAVLLLKA